MDREELTKSKFEQAFAEVPPRRREVLLKLLAGETDEQIAQSLGILTGTVRRQISTLCDDLGLKEESDERRSRRADLIALVAKYKPELLGISTAVNIGTLVEDRSTDQAGVLNPFIPLTGVINNPKHFFNRKQEIWQIFDFLRTGSSVAVVGDREIGKSSLLKAICRLAESQLQPFRQPVYLNLQPLKNEDDFYSALCDQAEIGDPDRPIKGYQLVRALRKRPLLIAIDEVENKQVFTSAVRSQLRGLAEGSDAPLRLVLAASQSLDQLFQDEGMTSPFPNIFIEEKIGLWDEVTSRAFILDRLNSTSVTFTEEEISQIIAETGGHPQKLMRRCYEIYARYMEAKP